MHFLACRDVGTVHKCIARTSFLCIVPFTSCFNDAATTLLVLTFKQECLLWLQSSLKHDWGASLYIKLHYITYSDNVVHCSSTGIRGAYAYDFSWYTAFLTVYMFYVSLIFSWLEGTSLAIITRITNRCYSALFCLGLVCSWWTLDPRFLTIPLELSDVCTRIKARMWIDTVY